MKLAITKKIKAIFAISIMVLFIFGFQYWAYTSTKSFYDRQISDTITKINRGSRGDSFYFSNPELQGVFIGTDKDKEFLVGDSVYKKASSSIYYIFRYDSTYKKRTFYKRAFLSDYLSYYSFIVKDLNDYKKNDRVK